MNSQFNVSSTNSTSSQMNHSSSLRDRNSSTGVPSSHILVQNNFMQNYQNNLLTTLRSPWLSVNDNSPDQGMHQQNQSSSNIQLSANVTTNRSLNEHSPTPSPPLQNNNPLMHSSDEAMRTSPNRPGNPTPSFASQMPYSMMYASNFANNNLPPTSDMPPLVPLQPYSTSLLSLLPAFSTTSFSELLNNTDYNPQMSEDPPPYSTAIQNNQTEAATYATLSSVPPSSLYQNSTMHDIPSNYAGLEQNALSCMQSFQVFDERTRELPVLIPSDSGVGTSIDESMEASRETSPGIPLHNSPVTPNEDDSMNGAGSNSMSGPPLYENIQQQSGRSLYENIQQQAGGPVFENIQQQAGGPIFENIQQQAGGPVFENIQSQAGVPVFENIQPQANGPVFENVRPQPGPLCQICGGQLTFINGQSECNICNAARDANLGKKKRKPQNANSSKKNVQNTCSNCHTSVTSLWRRDPIGRSLCNACGLYFKLHHKPRPQSMRKNIIQKRIRKPRNNEAKMIKLEPQSPPGDVCPAFATNNTPAIPYSVPSTSSSLQSALYYASTPVATGSTTSTPFQFPTSSSTSYQIQSFLIHNPDIPEELINEDAFTQYRIMQL